MNFSSTGYGKNGLSSNLGGLDSRVYSISHLFCVGKWRAERTYYSNKGDLLM